MRCEDGSAETGKATQAEKNAIARTFERFNASVGTEGWWESGWGRRQGR
jgi:hypothetical protein